MQTITNVDYVDKAEDVITRLRKNDRDGSYYLTTSAIRNLLTLSADILDEANATQGSELTVNLQNKLSYLRVQFIYRSGRDRDVKDFVEKAEIAQILKEIKVKDDLILFCRYMEALVAFKKYLDPKDK